MSISMKRYNDTIITPKDDRILFDQIFDDYGLIYGGSATMAASNKIHVGAARGFIKGTEVIIEAEDIAVNLSDSGTKNGRLKIVMDLADTETPIKFESEVAASFPALEQDANINYDNGRYEVVFATYKATETTISSVTLVMPTMQSVKAKMQGITQSLTTENGTKFRFGQTSNGEYGYILNKDGADTVIPFKKGGIGSDHDYLFLGGLQKVIFTTNEYSSLSGFAAGRIRPTHLECASRGTTKQIVGTSKPVDLTKYSAIIAVLDTSSSDWTKTVDISSLTGDYYIAVASYINGYGNTYFCIYIGKEISSLSLYLDANLGYNQSVGYNITIGQIYFD